MERVRLVGIARGDAQVLVQRTVVADDQGAFGRIDVLDPFDIELDDGRVLRVEPTKDVRIEPRREEKKQWGDIEDDPSFASLREKGPGPHVVVVVTRSAVRAGDRVALVGDEKDFAFDGEGASGMRSAPTKKLSAVTADVLAAGSDAEQILAHVVDEPDAAPANRAKKKRRKHEAPTRTIASYITWPVRFVIAALALFTVASTMRVSPGFVDFVAMGVMLCGVAVLTSTWESLPRFVRGKDVFEDESGATMGIAVVGALMVTTMLLLASR